MFGAGVASAAGGEGVVGDVVGGRWRVVVVVVAGLLGGCGVGGWLCVWWRVGVLGGGDGVSLRVVLGVVPLGVWFAITEHSPLRVARGPGGPVVRPAGGAGCSRVPPDGGCSVAGRGWVHCRAHTRPSGRRLFRSRQGLGSLPGAHTSVRTAAVS